jgi:hypothetical protein
MYALAITGLVGLLMLTLVTLSVTEGMQSGSNRARAAAVTTAEGAVDLTLAQVQSAPIASLPCGGTVGDAQSQPDTMSVTTTVQYFAVNGTPLSCPPAGNVVAVQAKVTSTSVATPSGGGTRSRRTVETLVALKPTYANSLDKAIFGQDGVSVGQHFNLYGQSGPNADVYTNGNFTCENNQRFRGSIIAQGTITLANRCTIDVNAWSKTGVIVNNANTVVSGDVLVSNGNATIGAGTVGGKVKALDVTPDSWCTSNPAKCVEGTTAAAPPLAQSFPPLNGDDATAAAYQAQGYTPVVKNDCTGDNLENPGRWIAANAATAGKTMLRTRCRLQFPTNLSVIKFANDFAFFADKGVDISQSLRFESTSSTVRELLFVHPYDFAARVGGTCAAYNPGISLTQQVQMSGTVKELLYSPCDVLKNNLGVLTGQVYSGGTVTIGQNTDVTYSPLSVFGVTASSIVESYTSDVLYKRENVG